MMGDPEPPDVTGRSTWIDVAILLLLCWALFFSFLGDRPLWDIDEGMHAHTSKVMVETGDWVTPTVNGEPFFDKPPLFNWLTAIAFLIFGFTEFAARLPAAMLGTATVMTTYGLGRVLFDRTTGVLAGVILASSLEFLLMSRVVVHDIALVFTVTCALFFFWLAADRDSRRRRFFLVGFYVSCGLAVLAKGPLGLVLVGLVVVPWLVLTRRLSFIRKMGLWWGIPVFLAVAAPWYLAVMRANADFGAYFFIQQNLMNFTSPESRHPEPWHYYVPILLGGFFPWSAFLPMAVGHGLRNARRDDRGRVLYLGLWAGLTLLFFTIASSKLPSYILPMFPALSILVAMVWRVLMTCPSPRMRRHAMTSLAVTAVVVVAVLAFYWRFGLDAVRVKYQIGDVAVLTPIAMLAAGLVTATILCWRRMYRASMATLVGMVVVLIAAVNLVLLPPLNPYRSTDDLGRRIDRTLPAGEPVVFYRDLRDSVLFYTDRLGEVLSGPGEFAEHMSQEGPAHCVVKRETYQEMDPKLLEGTFVVDGDAGKVVLSNRPPEDWGRGE